MKDVEWVIALDNALHCIIKYTVHQVISGIQIKKEGHGKFQICAS